MSKRIKVGNEREYAAQALIGTADTLCKAREQFEKETLARSNKALYVILADTYRLYVNAEQAKCKQELGKLMRDSLRKRGVKVQVNTPMLTMCVRYVFNSDRKRAYIYAKALAAAQAAGIAADGLAAYIEKEGGVEQCRRRFARKSETQQKREALDVALSDTQLALKDMVGKQTVTLTGEHVTFNDDTQFAFIVARKLSNGQFELLRVVPTTTKGMENAALNALAKDLVARKLVAVKTQKLDAVRSASKRAAQHITQLPVAA